MSDRPIPPLESLLEHRTWVRAVARRLLRDEHAAEDLAQEAWVRVMRSPPDPERDPKPWLRRVLKNLASNRRRGEARRTKRETAWREARAQRSPGELVAEAEQHTRLVGLVLDLEEPFKTALVLRFYEGLGPTEISRRLGIPVGTVHSRIARATERLKERLDGEEQGDRTKWIAALAPVAGFERAVPGAAAGAATTSFFGILLMTLTKPKVAALTVLLLGCLVGGGIYLSSLSSGDEPGTSGGDLLTAGPDAQRPVLEGRGTLRSAEASQPEGPQATAAAAPSDGSPWRGRVLDHEGRPAAGVEVFALARGAQGIDESELEEPRYGRQVTDVAGRFTVRIGDMERPRLIAWSERAMPASIDLADQEIEVPLELRLGAPRVVTVRVAHALVGGRADVGVNLSALDSGFDRTDDPARQSMYYWRDETEFGDGEAFVVPLNTTALVTATLDVPHGYTTIPRRHALRGGDEVVEFVVVPSAQVHYELIDASTSKPLAAGVRTTMFLFEAGTRTVVASRGTEDPLFSVTSDLAPGKYHYELKAQGYVQAEGEVVVREAGERIQGTLRLEPERGGEGGYVLLRVRHASEVSPRLTAMARTGAERGGYLACAVFVRRRGEAWRGAHATGRQDGQVEVWPRALAATPARFEDGHYDIYVAYRDTGTAALLRQVRLFHDRDNEFDVQLAPGTFVKVVELADKDEPLASVEVRIPDLGSLPWVEFKRWGWRTFVTPEEQGKTMVPPRGDRILGPFPVAEVEVAVTTAKGVTRTFRVRGAAVLSGTGYRAR